LFFRLVQHKEKRSGLAVKHSSLDRVFLWQYQLRIEYAGALYNAIFRGGRREDIFVDDEFNAHY
jgi:hypothetical protein